ncbi:MAG: prepilin peptidase [Candidatus Pacearchaeota archaeon]
MFHTIFLLLLGLIWVIFANVQDIKRNEIYNWVSFSLVIFALGFRFFYSLLSSEIGFNFFYQGLIGLVAFFVLGNLLYYGRMFAGGDATLMMALGTIIPFSANFNKNLELSGLFFVLFLFGGAIYGLFSTFYFALKHRKNFVKEFKKQFKKNQNIVLGSIFLGLLFVILGFTYSQLIWLGVFVFILPYLYLLANSVDRACMIKQISTSKLVEGDWIFKEVKAGGKSIKPKWEGLSKKEIDLLKKHKDKIWVRQGIPYSPAFLLSYLVLVYMHFEGLGIEIFSLL